jgi:hypothetical protein
LNVDRFDYTGRSSFVFNLQVLHKIAARNDTDNV